MFGIPSLHAVAAIFATVCMFVAFARGKMPVEIVSLCTIATIAIGLYLFPLANRRPEDGLALAFSGFGHYALVTICALMIMGRGLVVTGALEPLVRVLEKLWRINRWFGLLATLLLAFGLSTMVNDTPVLVLLIPVLVQLAARGGMASSKTLIPVNAAVLIGGMATTIGTSTNLLVVSIASDLGLPPMSVFHFTPLVLTAGLIALPYLWLVMPRLLRDNSVVVTHEPRKFRAIMRIGGGSGFIGRRTSDFGRALPTEFSLLDPADRPVAVNDRLAVIGTHPALEEATRSLGAELAPAWLMARIAGEAKQLREDLVVGELAVTADSRLVGRTIPTSGIADLYGVAVLGVDFAPRRWDTSEQDPDHTPLAEGDVLLVYGLPGRLREFGNGDALLTLDGIKEVPRRAKALLALGIMIGSVGMASLGFLPIAIAALGGAIAMFVTGCVRFDRIGRALSAKVIVLVAASIAVGKVVLETGAADWLGSVLAMGLQVLPPAGILAAIMVFVTLLTNFASNATAASVGTPIAFSIAQQLELPPEPLVLAVLFGCNLCYATPVAYQTNMLIMAEGNYVFKDYVRTGVPLVAIMIVTLSVLLVIHYGL
ncbi:SLC13 family permease [Novosphingobium sp. MW5]|nr:SLC13 family permease [Novosphingobium sp. MW5]